MRNIKDRTGLQHLALGLGLLALYACNDAAPPAADQPDIAAFCSTFRAGAEEAAAGTHTDAGDEQPTRSWPTSLPGMTPLALDPAPPASTSALLGPPCPGASDLWTVHAAAIEGHVVGVEEPILAVSAPSVIRLGAGRTAFIAVASEGQYHAAASLGVVALIDESRPERALLFAMNGAGAWGEAPTFNAPDDQPAGGWQIWSVAGDISFGDSEGWAGVTDLAGPAPRDLGRFVTYGRHLCMLDDTAVSQCQGGWEYVVTSISWSATGQLQMQWRMEDFDQLPSPQWWTPRKANVRTREIRALYEVRDGRYQLVEGEEPPRI